MKYLLNIITVYYNLKNMVVAVLFTVLYIIDMGLFGNQTFTDPMFAYILKWRYCIGLVLCEGIIVAISLFSTNCKCNVLP